LPLSLLLLLLLVPWLHVVPHNIRSNVTAADEQQVPAATPQHKLGFMTVTNVACMSVSEAIVDIVLRCGSKCTSKRRHVIHAMHCAAVTSVGASFAACACTTSNAIELRGVCVLHRADCRTSNLAEHTKVEILSAEQADATGDNPSPCLFVLQVVMDELQNMRQARPGWRSHMV
jgi:hypothetical protein